jgi:hypothetical protein
MTAAGLAVTKRNELGLVVGAQQVKVNHTRSARSDASGGTVLRIKL